MAPNDEEFLGFISECEAGCRDRSSRGHMRTMIVACRGPSACMSFSHQNSTRKLTALVHHLTVKDMASVEAQTLVLGHRGKVDTGSELLKLVARLFWSPDPAGSGGRFVQEPRG